VGGPAQVWDHLSPGRATAEKDVRTFAAPRERVRGTKDRRMIYFFQKGGVTLTCETRLNPNGPGYELVVNENGGERIEPFETLEGMLTREHELLLGWRAQGWRDSGAPAPRAYWSGP
jgi:hypothetical protein